MSGGDGNYQVLYTGVCDLYNVRIVEHIIRWPVLVLQPSYLLLFLVALDVRLKISVATVESRSRSQHSNPSA